METNTTSITAPAAESNNHHHHHNAALTSTSILIIIIAIIAVIILLAIFLIILMLRKLHSTKHNNATTKTITASSVNNTHCKFLSHTTINFNSSPDVNSGSCLYGGGNVNRTPTSRFRGVQVYTYRELEMATDGFNEANLIGKGGFGLVYKGMLSDGTVAAIKVLHREGKQIERAFRIEVDLLSRLNSPYLVELLGYCADQQHRLLIFEFMPNNTLQHHLHSSSHDNKCQPLDWSTRIRIASDCARALEFLHENSIPAIIHRDFKCSSILLDQNFRAKVTDFGMAKTGSDKLNGQISTRVLGTTGYLAPEYASTGKLTTKSDVYSYGIVLLELLTGRVPVDSKRPPGEHVLVSWALPRLTNREKVMEMVDPTLQGQYSKKDLIQVAAIAAVCVQPEADYRPLMTDVAQSLIPMVKNLTLSSAPGSSRFMNQTTSPRY